MYRGVQPTCLKLKLLYCIVFYCIEEVVIAAQCTATFSDLLCSPEIGY